jgi:predicted dehydrogenase
VSKVAIIGCGKIADEHVAAIRRTTDGSIVAVCDREPMMAEQLADRFGIEGRYHDVAEMLARVRPEIVHVTTPPQSHFELARQCLAGGCHVYLEKPFTVTAQEAASLLSQAESSGLILCAGHNCQFTPEMLEMRRLIESGYLGGPPIHVESYWPYGLDDPSYVGPMLADPNHWVRRLPGQLFHNIVSHGIARIAEFLRSEPVELHVSVHQSEQLRALGGVEVMDELRVLLRDGAGITALFSFSTQIRPPVNALRIYGPEASLVVDFSNGSVLKSSGRSPKSYLTFVLPQLRSARQLLGSSLRNMQGILAGRYFHDAGMGELIKRFHVAVATRGAPPIPYREVLMTARIMDRIFESYPARGMHVSGRAASGA